MKFLCSLLLVFFSFVLDAQCDSGIFIPEKFDWKQMTDSTRFKPTFRVESPDKYEFIIHNKWGETMFYTDIPEQGWNGLLNNRKGNCTAGTFMWTLNCTWSSDSTSVYCMGYVTCLSSRAVTITALDTLQCRPVMYVPNVITPNGDGLYEDFRPVFGCMPVNFAMQIFDRWGNLIFETKDLATGWDGTSKGQQQEAGVYVWKITWKAFEGDKQRTLMNNVTLIR